MLFGGTAVARVTSHGIPRHLPRCHMGLPRDPRDFVRDAYAIPIGCPWDVPPHVPYYVRRIQR